jgi:hypothetical protein
MIITHALKNMAAQFGCLRTASISPFEVLPAKSASPPET